MVSWDHQSGETVSTMTHLYELLKKDTYTYNVKEMVMSILHFKSKLYMILSVLLIVNNKSTTELAVNQGI